MIRKAVEVFIRLAHLLVNTPLDSIWKDHMAWRPFLFAPVAEE
jgi:hypothetical protein